MQIITVDAQINYAFLKAHVNLKLGASNLTNKHYRSFLGGPAVGGFYYTTLTYNLQRARGKSLTALLSE